MPTNLSTGEKMISKLKSKLINKQTKVQPQRYIITNMSLDKKVCGYSSRLKSVENPTTKSRDIKKYIKGSKYSNLIIDKNRELHDLKDFMSTLKNSNVRVVGDMVPLNYDKKTNWEVLSNAIIDPETDDGKLCWNEITNFKNG